MSSDMTPDRLARAYVKAKKAHAAAQATADGIEADMKSIKLAMKDWLLANGSKSTKTEYGTITMLKSTRYYTNEWAGLDAWLTANNVAPSAMYEHRLAQKNVAQYLTDNPDNVPPGLSSETDFSIRVTAPSKSV